MEENKNEISFKELIEKLHENGMMYFYLVSLISSDTLTSIELCEKSKLQLEELIKNIPLTSLTEVEKKKYLDYCYDGIDICERDKKEFESIN